MLARVAFLSSGLLAVPAVALAGDGDAPVVANYYSSLLERQLMHWHVWTTGVSRLDDGTLFGLVSILLAMAFGCSGLGIIMFRETGLGFRGGWLLSLVTIVGSLVFYTTVHPYPASRDVAPMLLVAALASLFALFVARMMRGSATSAVEHPGRKADPKKRVHDQRMKMAVRNPSDSKRAY